MLNSLFNKWVYTAFVIALLLSLFNKAQEKPKLNHHLHHHPIFSVFLQQNNEEALDSHLHLDYDYYRRTCPNAEKIVSSTMARIYSDRRDVSAALLRLLFHDCFIGGCDASIFLDDSHGNRSYMIEREATPHSTLKGFNRIDQIKEELERVCPGVVSCSDTLALATRDGVLLAGGPYYPVFTGRKDSTRSHYAEAMRDIPGPFDDVNSFLHLFSVRGFSMREIVSLLGSHNIGTMSCQFIRGRLYSFRGTGQPDPTMDGDFLNQLRVACQGSTSNGSVIDLTTPPPVRPLSVKMRKCTDKMSFNGSLITSISSGRGFDTHYYKSLLKGRGLLFSDQQLMANEQTARLVRAYASDDGTTFRVEFARAMFKLSNLNVLHGSQGQVRTNCSLPVHR